MPPFLPQRSCYRDRRGAATKVGSDRLVGTRRGNAAFTRSAGPAEADGSYFPAAIFFVRYFRMSRTENTPTALPLSSMTGTWR